MKSLARILISCAAALLAAGCATTRKTAPKSSDFAPRNYVRDAHLQASIRRVVLLPVNGGGFAPPEACEALDPVMATALQRQMRFEVVTFPREECLKLYGVPDLSSAAALPHDFLQTMGAKYGAQAVMFVDLTSYQAYRPLTLGIRAKLAVVAERRLAWSIDEVFSTTDPAVVSGVRHYYQHNELGSVPFDLTSDDLQSPGRFAAYVADVAFRTLPPR
jgi:hypothetical protein